MVVEGHVPNLAQQTFNGKIVKIFVVPSWDKEFSTFFSQYIGQGIPFCTQFCVTAHHHASVKRVMPDMLYVAKSTTMAFVAPSITMAVIDGDILTEWKILSSSLSDWNEKFFIATAASDDIPASTVQLWKMMRNSSKARC
jgi:hypothetical protein